MDAFENHCWQDVIPADVLERAADYRRDLVVGPAPALIAIDLYEWVYQGGPKPIAELHNTYPISCGEFAWRAIEPTQRLFEAARAAHLPVFYTTMDVRTEGRPTAIYATKRQTKRPDPEVFAIRPEFKPAPGDIIITKQRASAFYGTPLAAHLTQLGVRTVIVCGESTSGCVRASVVDAYSAGYHVVVVEECCYDRVLLSHKINLFDLHHKYADVMHIDEVLRHLEKFRSKKEG